MTRAGSAILVAGTNWERVTEVNLFAFVLAVQSLPFLSATCVALLERSRINGPLFWRIARRGFARVLRKAPRRADARPMPAMQPGLSTGAPALGHEIARDAACSDDFGRGSGPKL